MCNISDEMLRLQLRILIENKDLIWSVCIKVTAVWVDRISLIKSTCVHNGCESNTISWAELFVTLVSVPQQLSFVFHDFFHFVSNASDIFQADVSSIASRMSLCPLLKCLFRYFSLFTEIILNLIFLIAICLIWSLLMLLVMIILWCLGFKKGHCKKLLYP